MTTNLGLEAARPAEPSADPSARARLTGVGVGPGDPELITLKGARAIRAADIVFVPVRHPGASSFALQIANDLVDRRRQVVVEVPFPDDAADGNWEQRCRSIVERLTAGTRAVLLAEGDPMLYSTIGHIVGIVPSLAPTVEVDVIPGVSSITAAAAAALVPLAAYGERVAIVPAMEALPQLAQILVTFETVVLIKVSSVLRPTIALLDDLGLLDHAVYVRRCGRADQEIVHDLWSLAERPPRDYFSLILVRRSAD